MPKRQRLGRTGYKHQKVATHDIHRQAKAEGGSSRAAELLCDAIEAANEAVLAHQSLPEPTILNCASVCAPASAVPPPNPATFLGEPLEPLEIPSVRERTGQRGLGEAIAKMECDLERARAYARGLKDRGTNDCCDCAYYGFPTPGHPCFIEHHLLCRIYKCYAYEVGCCDGLMWADGLYLPSSMRVHVSRLWIR